MRNKIIGGFYRKILKPIYFRLDPEFVHDRITGVGKFLGSYRLTRRLTRIVFDYQNPKLVQNISGVKFINPVGLAAGFDKNANLLSILPEVGFGSMEVGSISFESYEGNAKPRLFRLPKSEGLVVYYGLKNDGVEKILPRIKKAGANRTIGISIAKTNCQRTSTEAGGIKDYYDCLKRVEQAKAGDYYTINISCPNTFGGEPFTSADKLERLLSKLSELQVSKPLFVKLPINLEIKEFDALMKVCVKYKMAGVIIGNLTKVRDPKLIKDEISANIKGGISGKPTRELSNKLISYAYSNYGKELIVIGVGGISSAEDAYEKIKRGASLLQLITGMIYQGPQLINEINRGLVKLLEQDGYDHISNAIGAYHKTNIHAHADMNMDVQGK